MIVDAIKTQKMSLKLLISNDILFHPALGNLVSWFRKTPPDFFIDFPRKNIRYDVYGLLCDYKIN